jgi:hypothetical protein
MWDMGVTGVSVDVWQSERDGMHVLQFKRALWTIQHGCFRVFHHSLLLLLLLLRLRRLRRLHDGLNGL